MNNQLKNFSHIIRNLITFSAVPFIILIFIYISYGEILEGFFGELEDLPKLYQLQSQIEIFKSDVYLPFFVKDIGYYSILGLYLCFVLWIISFSYLTYLKLSNQVGSKFIMFIEWALILCIYIFIISPDLTLWLIILGYLFIIIDFAIFIMYWIYQLNSKYEKK